jgi:outer membrane protein assembly factor BamE
MAFPFIGGLAAALSRHVRAGLQRWRPVYHRGIVSLRSPMHSMIRNVLLAAFLAPVVAGCGILYKQPIYQGNLIEKANADQLAVGQSKQQVMALLGTPSIADPFHANRWDYTASERLNRRGTTQVKNLTVFFENDAVTSWEGEYFPEQDLELASQTIRQFGPNLAKDKKKGGR